MKRSKSLSLCLMAGSAVALSACGDDEVSGKLYSSAEACAAGGIFASDDCHEAVAEALVHDRASSPRYFNDDLCEEEFGNGFCERHDAGYYGPSVHGFFFTHFPDARDGKGQLKARPYYRTRRGQIYTSSGTRIWLESNGGGRVQKKSMIAKPVSAKVQTRTSVVARGGFGSRSSSRSSWGG